MDAPNKPKFQNSQNFMNFCGKGYGNVGFLGVSVTSAKDFGSIRELL